MLLVSRFPFNRALAESGDSLIWKRPVRADPLVPGSCFLDWGWTTVLLILNIIHKIILNVVFEQDPGYTGNISSCTKLIWRSFR